MVWYSFITGQNGYTSKSNQSINIVAKRTSGRVSHATECPQQYLVETKTQVPCFRRRGMEENRLGVRGMKCNVTIRKIVGEMYTNYTVESVEFAGYLP